MKYLSSIIFLIIQFHLFGQPNSWDQDALKKNKIKDVSIYVRVPKTNPEHPLMLLKQFWFDSLGRVTKENCRRCDVSMHNGSFDVVEVFEYEGARLAKISRESRGRETITYIYDETGRRRVGFTTNASGERTEIALEYFDSVGRDTLKYVINFSNAYKTQDSVYQIHVDQTNTQYGFNTVTTEHFWSNDFVDFGRAIHVSCFDTFKNSTIVDEIERKLHMMRLKPATSGYRTMTERSTQKSEIKNLKTGEIQNIYYFGDTGLVKEEEALIGKRIRELEYHYSSVH